MVISCIIRLAYPLGYPNSFQSPDKCGILSIGKMYTCTYMQQPENSISSNWFHLVAKLPLLIIPPLDNHIRAYKCFGQLSAGEDQKKFLLLFAYFRYCEDIFPSKGFKIRPFKTTHKTVVSWSEL